MQKKIIEIKDRLARRSEFFCPAKWNELYLYLNHGLSNSCHHPIPHAIPEHTVANNPFSLHNTEHKLQQQQKMLLGQRPDECHMCWHIEDSDPGVISDRILKSVIWEKDIEALQVDAKHVPPFIEVVFDNYCNLGCSYCDSGQSTTWATRISKAPMDLATDHRNLYRKVHIAPGSTKNLYHQAWLDWWPGIADRVQTLKVSGGEPFLSNNFWEFYQNLESAPWLRFSINSNFSVDTARIQELIQGTDRFGNVMISVSVDGQGSIAEYARKGLDFSLMMRNIEHWCTHSPDNCFLHLQSTVNIFSIWGFVDFLDLVLELRRRYPNKVRELYTTVVRFPEFQCISLLPREIKDCLVHDIDAWLSINNNDITVNESALIGKIRSYLANDPEPMHGFNPDQLLADLRTFARTYDQYGLLRLADIYPKEFQDWLDFSTD